MKHLPGIILLLSLLIFLSAMTGLAQAETFCAPGQAPQFIHGFAFLKRQLGDMMGEPLECEHYDLAGNAFQKTTTGQAFYRRETNTPTFTMGNRQWAWTPAGLEQWVDQAEAPKAVNTPWPTPPISLQVMSYNVLFGAGINPDWEQTAANQRPFSYPGNRLAEILSVIRAAEPNILGIQEAAGWDRGTPPIAQQVADDLGMNHFLALTANDLHLVLFTKFQIVEAENLSAQVGNVGALRATLLTAEGQTIYVFMIHLDPFSAATRAQEITVLTQFMAPYLHSPTLLLGDTNIQCLDDLAHCQEYQLLSGAGWHLGVAGDYMLDQIWTSPELAGSVSELTFPGASFDISDHLPVGAMVELEW